MENQETDTESRPPATSRGLVSPLFYFSHVSPSAEDDDGPRHDDVLFRTFFDDLSLAVAQRTPAAAARTPGYLADEKTADADRARALAACQVFVPLLSPLYFHDQRCGRDWQVFRSRVPAPSRADRFVPVIWTPVRAVNIPTGLVGSEIGPIPEDRPDAPDGLYSLLIGGDEEQYAQVVAGVATSVVEVARTAPLPASRPVADLSALRSAFEAPPQSKLLPLRILILAPTSDQAAAADHASGATYGPRQLDWAPYGASFGRTLAADVEDVAERNGYQPEIAAFDEATMAALRAGRLRPAPTVLVIDNWALLDQASCDRVREYVAMDVDWQLFMVVREPAEPGAEVRVEALRNAVNATLEEPLARLRIDVSHVASGEGIRFGTDFALIAGLAAGRFRRSR